MPRKKASSRPPVTPPPPPRYEPGREIGRGGLGRVIEAIDTHLDRPVALKLLLDGAPLELATRFRQEGALTARLEHPNIVPVHDGGVLPGGGIFFSMKRIAGRDMAAVLEDLRRGRPSRWTQRRLLEALRDAARAVAFAHSRRVVHRDLKPSNIMLGEFGETLVVDWGLAKETGAAQTKRRGTKPRKAPPALTLDGDVMGTPEYMSPEQASGEVTEIDARSDVWSLGAILYEILCGSPPFTGASSLEVISKVVSSSPEAPSSVRRRRASEYPVRSRAPGAAAWPEVPHDLENACLRALARRKAERFPDASAFAEELDSHLEGSRERERRRKLADEFATQAATALAAARDRSQAAASARADADRIDREIPNHAPREEKKRLWSAQDHAEEFAREGARLAAEANASLDAALANAPEHPEARRLMAELHWDRFVEAEAAGDRRGEILHRRQAERWNDGSLDLRLRGEGALSLRTRAWDCACLRDGRDVPEEELNVFGYHPWSGRRLEGAPVESVPELEGAGPLRLRVHAPGCARRAVEGVEAWAWRYEEIDRVRIPVSALEGGTGCPAPVLDRLFGDSPYRPRGPGLHLGSTPIAGRRLPRGSWLVVLAGAGRTPQRFPVRIERLESTEAEVTLYADEELPAGFLPVAGGEYFSQGDPGNPASGPAAVVDMPDVLISQFPVTCADYLAFLNDLARTGSEDAARRAPRKGEGGRAYWPRLESGAFAIPDAAWLASAPEPLRATASRLDSATADWMRAWPVLGVSWADASAYARWRSLRDGRLYSLVHEDAREKAGRGTDARAYPWGDAFDPCLCNAYGSHGDGYYPVPVRDCPYDESPYGIRGLAGNSWDWCLNDPGLTHAGFRIGKGGAFTQAPPRNRMSHSGVNHIGAAFFTNGIRLAAACALTPPGETWYREDRKKRRARP